MSMCHAGHGRQDRPTMSPASFTRGAVSLGVRQKPPLNPSIEQACLIRKRVSSDCGAPDLDPFLTWRWRLQKTCDDDNDGAHTAGAEAMVRVHGWAETSPPLTHSSPGLHRRPQHRHQCRRSIDARGTNAWWCRRMACRPQTVRKTAVQAGGDLPRITRYVGL